MAAKPDLSEPVQGSDGQWMQSVVVNRSFPFARACLAEMKRRDGTDRAEWMRRKSFWVPVDVIDAARASLEAAGAGQ